MESLHRCRSMLYKQNLTKSLAQSLGHKAAASTQAGFSCLYVHVLSRVSRFATPQTVDHQASPVHGTFHRQENWNGLPFPSPGDLPDSGIKPESPALAGGFFTTNTTWEDPTPGKSSQSRDRTHISHVSPG